MASVWIRTRKLERGGHSHSIYYKDPGTGQSKLYKTLRKKGITDKKANELRTFIDSGEFTKIEVGKRKSCPMTLKQCSALALAEVETKVHKGKRSEETLSFYTDQHRKALSEFGNHLVPELTKDMIETYHQKVGKEVSARTANARLHALKMMMRVAVAEHVIPEDITKGIEDFVECARNRSLTPQELNALLLGCQGVRNPKRMKAAILLAAEHGAALQEIVDLRWSHIDFDLHMLGTIEFERRKNGEERLQYLMPRTRKALKEWREHLKWIRKRKRIVPTSDLVFGRLDGQQVERLDTAWARVLETAGIKDLHFHDLRAAYCTNLALAGASTKAIQELIGHKDPRSTDRYIRIQKLFALRPLQARLAFRYEHPEEFDRVLREGQEKEVLQIGDK